MTYTKLEELKAAHEVAREAYVASAALTDVVRDAYYAAHAAVDAYEVELKKPKKEEKNMTDTIKTFAVYETISVQKCYTVEAGSEEEAKRLHNEGQSDLDWSEEGDVSDIFVEELED